MEKSCTSWLKVPELPLKFPLAFVYTAVMVCGEPTDRVAIAQLVAVAVSPDPDSVSGAPNAAPSIEN